MNEIIGYLIVSGVTTTILGLLYFGMYLVDKQKYKDVKLAEKEKQSNNYNGGKK